MRRVVITREEEKETREVGKRRVGCQDEDEQRREAEHVIAERTGSERDLGDLAQQDLIVGVRWVVDGYANDVGCDRRADHHEGEECAHDGQRQTSVAPLGWLERRDTVTDRLHARKCARAGRERLQDDQDGQHGHRIDHHRWVRRPSSMSTCGTSALSGGDLEECPREHREHRGHEEIGGGCEDGAGLANTAKVSDSDDRDRSDA